jgi:hypothetical protein
MNSVKNVWAMLEHSGFDSDTFCIATYSQDQEVLLNLSSDDEGAILAHLSLNQAIKLKNELSAAIDSIFDETSSLEKEYKGEV